MTEKEFVRQAISKGWSKWTIQKAVEIDRARGAFDEPKKDEKL